MHPSRRAILIIAAGVALAAVPVLVGADLWLLWLFFWALTLLLVAVDVVLVPRTRDISHAVVMPDTLYMGEPSDMLLTLRIAGARGVPTRVKLDLSDTLMPLDPVPVRLGDRDVEVTFPLRAKRRGMGEVEALWLRYAGPFGLIERTVRIDLSRPIDAVPNIRGVRRAALEFFSPNEFRSGLRIEQFAGDGSEFDSLREFTQGMDHRTIDWKASARHTLLLARKFRAERNRQVVIAIDTGHLMAEPLDGVPRLDHAIHAALLLSYFSTRTGDRVGLYAFGDTPKAFNEPRAGVVAFRAMLKLTGRLDYGEAETNYTLGLTHLMTRLNRRSLVVVLTDFVDTVTAELMIENIQRVARRHLVVFVSLSDPLLDTVAAQEPRNLEGLNQAVVAESFLRERELVVTRLRRHGIFCIDAPPDRIGVDLINRYLQIKRREMI